MGKKELDKIFRKRIEFYAMVSKKKEVVMEQFQALAHNKVKDFVFLHLKYQMIENGKPNHYEEIETFTDDGGWMCLFNQNDLEKLNHFLSETTKSEIDCSNVKIKKTTHEKTI